MFTYGSSHLNFRLLLISWSLLVSHVSPVKAFQLSSPCVWYLHFWSLNNYQLSHLSGNFNCINSTLPMALQLEMLRSTHKSGYSRVHMRLLLCQVWCESVCKYRRSIQTNIQTSLSNYSMIMTGDFNARIDMKCHQQSQNITLASIINFFNAEEFVLSCTT